MKKLLLIICFILAFLIGANSQIPATKILVADETWIVKSTTTTFRLITANDSIASKIVYLIGITRFTAAQKQDRNGYYWERSFYFNNKYWNSVVTFIDSLNKKP